MKKVVFFYMLTWLFFSCGVEIPSTARTETFHVWGNCNMCKKTIEKSVRLNGVYKANWNKKTDMITVVFNPQLISLDQIKQHIANAGYDNDEYRAENSVYDDLRRCCKYEREKQP